MNPPVSSSNAHSQLPIGERILGYLGLLPFVYLALNLPVPGWLIPVRGFVAYSAIILAFMAGSLWRHSVASSVFSNLVAIAAFAALLLPLQPAILLIPLALLYGLLWWWEGRHCRRDTPDSYWQLRCRLTLMVVVCHLMMFARVIL
nr:DUF3429 domain-containing protein [Aestuariicella hydrocarbonica]